jgi:hypothetical protein
MNKQVEEGRTTKERTVSVAVYFVWPLEYVFKKAFCSQEARDNHFS